MEPLPRSTIIVGGALWMIVVGLQVWVLGAILMTKDKVADQSRDIAVIGVKQEVYARQFSDLKDDVQTLAATVKSIETRQVQASHP